MKIFLLSFLILILLIFVDSKYEIILDRCELPLGDEEKVLKHHSFRIKKFNRTTAVMSGVFEIKMEMNNDAIVSFEASNLSGGQYKKIFGRVLGNFCDVTFGAATEKEVNRFMQHSNFSTVFGECPMPPQFVNVNDWVPKDLGDYLPPYVPGNERWKVTLWLTKNDEVICGFTVFAILRDDQKLFDSKW